MNYGHYFKSLEPTSTELQECTLCGLQFSYSNPQDGFVMNLPCPERIVREVVRRLTPKETTLEFSPLMNEEFEESLTRLLRAELQNANIIPAKRKDRP